MVGLVGKTSMYDGVLVRGAGSTVGTVSRSNKENMSSRLRNN